MQKTKESQRIKSIEKEYNKSIEDLLYNWHWKNNLKHREIGKKLTIPRPTITRWFKQLKVPTQSCTRFTNNNLLYFGPNQRPRKPKPVKKPKERIPVNEDFFKKWSPEMAYVLGYFAADGCMFINPRGSHYIGFYSTDYELIYKIKKILGSKQKLAEKKRKYKKWKPCYQLQIGSKKMYQSLIKYELRPNKSKYLNIPNIPKRCFRHFVRGYFDGDGCVSFKFYTKKGRIKPNLYFNVRFSAGKKLVLQSLHKILKNYKIVENGYLNQKSRGYDLSYGVKDSLSLYKYMYTNVSNNHFLERKYNIFQKAIKHYGPVA